MALTIVSGTTSARAETPSTVPVAGQFEASTVAPVPVVEPVEPTITSVSTVAPDVIEPIVTQVPEDTAGQVGVQQANLGDIQEYSVDSQSQPLQGLPNNVPTTSEGIEDVLSTQPIPGTVETSVTALEMQPEASSLPEVSSEEANTTIAQEDIDPGRATRGGASYIGIGGNIGLGGDTALGGGAFVINGKLGLTRTLSFRPAAIIADDTVFLLPLTYDFVIRREDPFEEVPFAPFLGGGVAFSTDEDDNIGFLITGGVDVPISRGFIGNASLSVGFLEDTTDVGLTVGVGYSFVGF